MERQTSSWKSKKGKSLTLSLTLTLITALLPTLPRSGLTNAFADRPGSWYCVSLQDIIDADPDVFVIVDANWDSAVGKLDYLHNHSDYCNLRAVQEAEYIKIQFSASTLGPRNGIAALDMVSAAMHLHTGDAVLNFQSGVDIFEDEFLKDHTASLKCPYAGKKKKCEPLPPWAPPSPPSPPLDDPCSVLIDIDCKTAGIKIKKCKTIKQEKKCEKKCKKDAKKKKPKCKKTCCKLGFPV